MPCSTKEKKDLLKLCLCNFRKKKKKGDHSLMEQWKSEDFSIYVNKTGNLKRGFFLIKILFYFNEPILKVPTITVL